MFAQVARLSCCSCQHAYICPPSLACHSGGATANNRGCRRWSGEIVVCVEGKDAMSVGDAKRRKPDNWEISELPLWLFRKAQENHKNCREESAFYPNKMQGRKTSSRLPTAEWRSQFLAPARPLRQWYLNLPVFTHTGKFTGSSPKNLVRRNADFRPVAEVRERQLFGTDLVKRSQAIGCDVLRRNEVWHVLGPNSQPRFEH